MEPGLVAVKKIMSVIGPVHPVQMMSDHIRSLRPQACDQTFMDAIHQGDVIVFYQVNVLNFRTAAEPVKAGGKHSPPALVLPLLVRDSKPVVVHE
jgi:hypothetical protein